MTTDELYTGMWVDYYDKLFTPKNYQKGFEIIQQAIKRYHPSTKKILEIACGSGNYTLLFAQAGYGIKATDIADDMLAKAREKIGDNPNVELSNESFTDLNEQSIYDAVFCLYEAIRYQDSFDTLKKTLQNIYTALKPQGIFIFDYHHFPASPEGKELNWNEVGMGNGVKIQEKQKITSKGDHDYRESYVRINNNGKETEQKLQRAPLLRISEEIMSQHLEETGFEVKEVQRGFIDGLEESMFFVAQKID